MATSTTLTTPAVTYTLGTVLAVDLDPLGSTGWQAFVVDGSGTQVRELDVVGWGDLDEQMGRPANMTITVAKDYTAQLDDMRDALELGYEVQVYRDGVLLLWAVPLQESSQSGPGVVSFALVECVPWYLGRRRCRRGVALSELLRNGGFESGKSHWTGAGSVTGAQSFAGSHSLEINSNGATAAQRITVSQAATIVVRCKVRLDSGTFAGPNDDGFGLEVYATPWTGFGGFDKYGSAALGYGDPLDAWITKGVVVEVPDGYWDVYVRLRGPDGKVWFDEVTAQVLPQPRRTEWAGIFPPEETPTVDQGRLLREALASNIDGLNLYTVIPDTGVTMEDEPGAFDDRYLSEVLDLVAQRENGVEWAGVYTPPTRGVKVWYPRSLRGTSHSSFVLTFGAENSPAGPNLASYSLDVDQTKARTMTVVVGEGGFTGEASDASSWAIVLEEIVRASGATPIPDLEGVAREHLRSDPARVTALSVTTVEAANDLIGVLRMADRCVVYVDDGPSVSFSGTYQVVGRRVKPGSDSMTLTLNEVA